MGFKLTTLVAIVTDWIGSCTSNHHMIMTTTGPQNIYYVLNIAYILIYNVIQDWNLLFDLIKSSSDLQTFLERS
jgi:hypothetical protein